MITKYNFHDIFKKIVKNSFVILFKPKIYIITIGTNCNTLLSYKGLKKIVATFFKIFF